MSRFIQGGRLKAIHKTHIDSKDFMKRLNEVAKEKVSGQVHKNDNGRP